MRGATCVLRSSVNFTSASEVISETGCVVPGAVNAAYLLAESAWRR